MVAEFEVVAELLGVAVERAELLDVGRVAADVAARVRISCAGYEQRLVHVTLKHADIIAEAPFASNPGDSVSIKNISELLLLGKEG